MIERRSTVIWSLVCLGVLVISVLGWWQSPVEHITGRPLLLLREVKGVADYQTQARLWTKQLQELDAAITGLQLDTNGDLFSQSQQGNRALQQAMLIAQTVDQTKAPATLLGLHSGLKTVSLSYLDAARVTLRTIGAPSPENRIAAQNALEQARKQLDEVKHSEWINQ